MRLNADEEGSVPSPLGQRASADSQAPVVSMQSTERFET